MTGLQEVRPGVWFLDTWQFGVPGQGGIYILQGRPAALVESGTSLARDRILAALEHLGLARPDVHWMLLTHIHLDHAGGAGALLQDLPRARVVVHERGARHLIDPARLVASVKEAVRDRFPLYGDAVPLPPDRVYTPKDGEVLEVGRFRLRVVDAPGHAPHHLCFFEENLRVLFSGDAAGLYLDKKLLPTTVPPSFDLEAALATLERLKALQPEQILFTHFGPGSPELLDAYARLLREWVALVDRLRRVHTSESALVEAVLAEAQGRGWTTTGPAKADLSMSVRGVLGYLARKEGAR